MIRAFVRSVVDAMLDRVFTWALWRGVRDRDARPPVVVSYRCASISPHVDDDAAYRETLVRAMLADDAYSVRGRCLVCGHAHGFLNGEHGSCVTAMAFAFDPVKGHCLDPKCARCATYRERERARLS